MAGDKNIEYLLLSELLLISQDWKQTNIKRYWELNSRWTFRCGFLIVQLYGFKVLEMFNRISFNEGTVIHYRLPTRQVSKDFIGFLKCHTTFVHKNVLSFLGLRIYNMLPSYMVQILKIFILRLNINLVYFIFPQWQ